MSPTQPQLLMLGTAFSRTKLPALNAEPARASLTVHFPETLSGSRNGKLSPISYRTAQGRHLDRKDWAWLKWKDSSEASTSSNGSFLMSQYQNHKCFPRAHKSRSHRILEHPHTAAGRATLEQWELNNKTWLYSQSCWDLLVPPAFWNVAMWLTWNKLKKLIFALERKSVCITLQEAYKTQPKISSPRPN